MTEKWWGQGFTEETTHVSNFLENILREEEKMRKILAEPKNKKMTQADWEKFRTARDCHICGKDLIEAEFLDSLPVWLQNEEIDDNKCWGQSHKRCHYTEVKSGIHQIILNKEIDQADKEKAKEQKNCAFCRRPLL